MVTDSFKLDKKVAVVTGCRTGLGAAIAVALAQAGADILGVGSSTLDDTQKQVQALGRRFVAVQANLSEMSSVQVVQAAIDKSYGCADILVNNAGIIIREDSINFTEHDWDAVMNLNLKVLFFLTQSIAKGMIEKKSGKIINIASLLSFQGGIRVPSYTASKSGVAGLTKLLCCEWAKYGIQTNAIAPGYMSTDNTEALRNDAARNVAILERIPAARWGDAQDITGAAVFLASSASNYVNGHILAVDGGWLAR